MTITICDRCKKEAKKLVSRTLAYYDDKGYTTTKRYELCDKCNTEYWDFVVHEHIRYELFLTTRFIKQHE